MGSPCYIASQGKRESRPTCLGTIDEAIGFGSQDHLGGTSKQSRKGFLREYLFVNRDRKSVV